MADINYSKVGWDTTKYVNPTNMNQMDNGIKAACDGVDTLTNNLADYIVTRRTSEIPVSIGGASVVNKNIHSYIEAVRPSGYSFLGLAYYEVGNINIVVTQVTNVDSDYSLIAGNISNSSLNGDIYLHIMFKKDI